MAKNIRLHELATELGMTNSEALELSQKLGVPVQSHSSSLNEAYADMVRRRAVREGLTRDEQPSDGDGTESSARVSGASQPLSDKASDAEAGGPPRHLRGTSGRPDTDEPGPGATHSRQTQDSPLTDPYGRAEALYPYPVAALVRATCVSDEAHVLRDSYLKLGESLVRTYGLIAVTFARISPEHALGKGAITTGKWLDAIRTATAASTSLPSGFSCAETKGAVGWHLGSLVALRNRTHHKQGVDSRAQVNAVVAEARNHVEAVLTKSEWMENTRWVGVSRCEFTDDGHVLRARVLRGSDSQWIRTDILLETPAVPGSVLAFDAKTDIVVDMSAFAKMTNCDTCMKEELFLLDTIGATSTFTCMAGHKIRCTP